MTDKKIKMPRVNGPFEQAEMRAILFASNFVLIDTIEKTLTRMAECEKQLAIAGENEDEAKIEKLSARLKEYEVTLALTAEVLEKTEGWSA